ncbi:site-specific integrase [Flavobacterium sp. MK4S-17]|uniref:site-specific integrase n=1 Tax=Flavobacterium sp. MK4S-17 TaxID=2543737 RepID=UPI0013593F5F|nr:site-specific integrase [Flavobacterium sp. MK4S-17]
MTVTIRKRKLKEGRYALYLDLYAHQNQWQENLKLYLENEKGNPAKKQMNKQTYAIAERIQTERLYQLQNDIFGFKKPEKTYRTFNEYFLDLVAERERTGVNLVSWECVYKHLNKFNSSILFTDLTVRYLEEFKSKLLNNLKPNSASSYFNILKGSIHEAYRRGLIKDNPAARVKCIKEVDTNREYLTKEEVDSLIATDCRYNVLKRAFLFSCLTGLRWSDVHNLKWKDVRTDNGAYHIVYTQRKTKNSEVLPIAANAVKLMGNIGDNNERVFVGLRYSSYFNTALFTWVANAGIKKHITFHCARHTNAILLLNNGVDIYTVSKMLGHRELKTTSVYAKVMNKTKIEAVEKLPNFSL